MVPGLSSSESTTEDPTTVVVILTSPMLLSVNWHHRAGEKSTFVTRECKFTDFACDYIMGAAAPFLAGLAQLDRAVLL